MTSPLSRRRFLNTTAFLATASLLPGTSSYSQPAAAAPRFRAAVIGHTGRGDYGHGLDVIFNDQPEITVVAVADPDETGRGKALVRCRAKRSYVHYQEMLDKEHPQLVSVGMRQTDQHHAAVGAALRSGAHVLVEKPFTATLAEADDLLALARQGGRRIAVAHQIPLSPAIRHLKAKLDAGLIGPLVSLRAHGKQDARAGGEDMIVLGTHLFDLMRYLAGEVASCTAQIRQRGAAATRADVHAATESIGPVLGDEIEAQLTFANGVSGTFTSRGRLRETLGHWGITLLGEKGAARILMDLNPRVFLRSTGAWTATGATDTWAPLPDDPTIKPSESAGSPTANRRVLDDFLKAIDEQRDPACSGQAGMKAVEIAHGIFTAGLSNARVTFPLANRKHPLA